MASEALTNDLRQEANTALLEVDKGLRSVRVGDQCEAIVKFPLLVDRFPFPVLINTAFLKIAEVFRTGYTSYMVMLKMFDYRNNFLRLNILKVLQLTEKHLQKIISMDEFIRRIYSVMHSNDSLARAVTLRLLLLTCLFFVDSSSCKIICVDNFEHACMQCDANVTLNESLQEYLDKHNASTNKEIILCSTEVFLQERITIKHVSFVTINSYFESSAIFCMGNGSGISFVDSRNITVRNIRIQNCGGIYYGTSVNISAGESSHKNLLFRTSLYFLNSTNLEINQFVAMESHGIGLTLINCNGSVLIQDSRFESNIVNATAADEALPGGGGLYIEFSQPASEAPVQSNENTVSLYTLKNCIFDRNIARFVKENLTSYGYTLGGNFQGLGRGGGLCIHFRKFTRKNVVNILNCTLSRNQAVWGGGMYLIVHDSAEANEVYIDNVTFSDNVCTLNGGGGVDVGLLFNSSQQPKKNKVVFQNSLFLNNQAEYGGGALVYSGSSSSPNSENEITFTNCKWEGNRAIFGAAVNLGTHSSFSLKKGFLPTPIFIDCSFFSNFVDKTLNISKNYDVEGKGAFAVINTDLIFNGKTNFTQNGNTALYLVSSNAKFGEGSDVVFQENRGKIGGAIVIEGLGSVEVNDSSNFFFIGNTAREKGGAIYQASHDINDYIVSRNCFIQYVGNRNISEREISFTFEKNKAGTEDSPSAVASYGNSIYVGTLKPCFTGCLNQSKFYNETFDCIASFTFDGDLNHQVATIGGKFSLSNKTTPLHAIPGGYMLLPLTLHDELGNEMDTLYHVYLTNKTHSSMILSENYISNKWIEVLGQPHSEALLRVETVDVWEVAASFPIKMSDCPPGFSLANYTLNGRNNAHCKCKAAINSQLYSGIFDCDDDTFSSVMKRGFWYGYDKHDGGFGKDSDLVSGYCPLRYCMNYENSTVLLPNSTNISKLDLFICGNRTGRLCGSCRGNLSTFFHTNSFECSSSEKCKYGLLLYLLTDILPITVFFIITIMLDINFTHGTINGLIFYFQVTDVSIHVTSGFVRCQSFSSRLQEIYALLSGIFNLKFFYHKDMSFCLWHGFQTLDILAFRYVNIVYALCLVIAIICITRAFSLKRIARKLPKLFGKSFNVKTTIIHGLSGFLVICYSECSKISLLLLTPIDLFYTNRTRTVVLLNGELDHFKGRHLIYALPAVFFLIVMGFIPPLLFISYPLCYRIFTLLRISESLFTKTLCRIFPLERFRPFFDSFQSSFKDEYRFYSGLYFLYRMITLLTIVATKSITNYLTVLIVEYAIILCLHAIVQPYKKRWHNVMDGCIFTNLIILTTLTLLSYRRSFEYVSTSHTVERICVYQALFLCAPLVFFLIMVIIKVITKLRLVKIAFKPKSEGYHEHELSESLLFARRDSITESTSHT